MLRGMTEPITIQKSRSCPADFSSDGIVRTENNPPRTPPASNGTSGRRKKQSSDSKKPSPYSLGGNGHGPVTMNVAMTSNGVKALPGRARRRGHGATTTMPKRKKNAQSVRHRLMNSRWIKNPMRSSNPLTSLIIAVFLWYTLGVISITTSNLLMMEPHNLPPLALTMQQLLIGATLLRFLLSIRFLGSAGIQPWPSPSAAAQAAEKSRRKNLLFNNLNSPGKNKYVSGHACMRCFLLVVLVDEF